MNILVGGYIVLYVGYMFIEMFKSFFLYKDELNPFHIIGSIYSVALLWTSFSFIYGNNFGIGIIVCTLILIVIPFLGFKMYRYF
jgi:hypothetical protein